VPLLAYFLPLHIVAQLVPLPIAWSDRVAGAPRSLMR
jgi:hypothetical protein